MNATVKNPEVAITVAEMQPKNYRKTVLELYVEAVENVIASKKSAQQVSIKGNFFTGLNNSILVNEGFKSNCWFSESQMVELGYELINPEAEGVMLFTISLRKVEGKNYSEKVLRYWKVFNKEQVQSIIQV